MQTYGECSPLFAGMFNNTFLQDAGQDILISEQRACG